MSKKGLITSLVLGLLVTLSLSIYTLVSVLAPARPSGPQVVHYYHHYRYCADPERPDQTDTGIDIFSKYGEGVTLKFETNEDVTTMPIRLNEQTGKYDAVAAGEVTVTAVLDKKGNEDVHHIIVHAQGDGSTAETPWIVAQPSHFIELANNFNESNTAEAPAYVELVDDIDLSGVENWKPIGTFAHPYNGNIEGNGVTISGLNINLTSENYQDFICPANDMLGGSLKAFIDLGLFGATKDAVINDVNLADVNISVATNVYEAITTAENYPDNMLQCAKFARLTVGSLVGYAEDTVISGNEEARSNASNVVLNAYGYTNDQYMNGVGGLVGAARRTSISNYVVDASVTDLNKDIKNVIIGGLVGTIDSQLKANNEYVDQASKSVIDNVEVSLVANVYYDVHGEVGGIAGRAVSVNITNSAVRTFRVNDPTIREAVVYGLDNTTIVGGVVGYLASYIDNGNSDLTTAMLSSVKEVTVLNVDITMLGGNVAGAFGIVGNGDHQVEDKIVIENVTVTGSIYANIAAGFVRQLNDGAKVAYTREIDGNVVDVRLKGQMLAGFASISNGTIEGFEGTNKTSVKVIATGVGAEPRTMQPSSIYNLRNATYVAGLVSQLYQNKATVLPSLKSFSVNVVGTNSINYAGVVQTVSNATIDGVNVKATFTSAYNTKGNYSPTYMVSGVANKVGAGTTIENCNVEINVNQVRKSNELYGAAYVGGLVARYTGDVEGKGLTLTGNTLTGNMYFNSLWDQYAVYFNEVKYDLFVAGGLVGSMSDPYDAHFNQPSWWDVETYGEFKPEYYDAIKAVEFTNTRIENNVIGTLITEEREVATDPENPEQTEVQNVVVARIPFAITLDVNEEEQGEYGYLTRALGATVGAVYTTSEDATLDLSTNVINRFEADVYQLAFTLVKDVEGSTGVKKLSVVNDEDKATYGVSYRYDVDAYTEAKNITDVSGAFDDEEVEMADRKIAVTLRK